MSLDGAKWIVGQLKRKGYEAYLVGGCVRDIYMNVEPNDFDIATGALPDEVMAIFNNCIPTGIDFGTVTVILDGSDFEVTTFRKDSGYMDGRRPSVVTFSGSIVEDLSRRDFTMNAMAMSEQGEIVDPFRGKSDIRKKLIRTVGKAEERFNEDRLRKLRAIRFAAQKGFDLDVEIIRAIKNDTSLMGVSVERIFVEMNKILLSDRADLGLELLNECGLLNEILPEMVPCIGFEQHHPCHKWTVFEHTKQVVVNTPNTAALRWAALLHDIGKPATFELDDKGIGHFYRHEKLSLESAANICKRLKMSTALSEEILLYIAHHMSMPVLTERAVKKWMRKIGPEKVDDMRLFLLADAKGTGTLEDDAYYIELKELVATIRKSPQVFDRSALSIDGNLLMDRFEQLKANPRLLSPLLEHLVEICLHSSEMNRIETLLKLSEEWIEKITEKSQN
ncbi:MULTISPECIES: CCA tRNA nucleotidyltransferase [unclassified Fusibacter]|uniref:CCA tRNA nucleotidyltransferase n=1 Tax=unclassified Fusibacter TaxID=2624464 RepID=UPI0013E984C7|nr:MULTISPECIES: CCA tRNA nucleotidyltransferase [unclassified Fusibacter]MCK8059774.1 CCA tRNA nucleotidyltransferase [Fusibacter sp. A2]NPE21575.1 CCA tRNA nucleotidyltransferase [Fusibacter sp. A1]